VSGGTTVELEIGMEGGVLLLITRTPSYTEMLTGSHFVLKSKTISCKLVMVISYNHFQSSLAQLYTLPKD
jgi:uncharacterized membrane protein